MRSSLKLLAVKSIVNESPWRDELSEIIDNAHYGLDSMQAAFKKIAALDLGLPDELLFLVLFETVILVDEQTGSDLEFVWIDEAISVGHVDLLQACHLLSPETIDGRFNPDPYMGEGDTMPAYGAIKNNRLSSLTWYHDIEPTKFRALFVEDDYFLYAAAIAFCRADLVKWLLENMPEAFQEAISHFCPVGNVELFDPTFISDNPIGVDELKAMFSVLSEQQISELLNQDESYSFYFHLISNNSRSALAWLYENRPNESTGFRNFVVEKKSQILDWAIETKRLHLLDWLFEEMREFFQDFSLDWWIESLKLAKYSVGVLKFFYKVNPALFKNMFEDPNYCHSLLAAISNHRLGILMWLNEVEPDLGKKLILFKNYSLYAIAFVSDCSKSKEILKWVSDQFPSHQENMHKAAVSYFFSLLNSSATSPVWSHPQCRRCNGGIRLRVIQKIIVKDGAREVFSIFKSDNYKLIRSLMKYLYERNSPYLTIEYILKNFQEVATLEEKQAVQAILDEHKEIIRYTMKWSQFDDSKLEDKKRKSASPSESMTPEASQRKRIKSTKEQPLLSSLFSKLEDPQSREDDSDFLVPDIKNNATPAKKRPREHDKDSDQEEGDGNPRSPKR